MTNKNKFRYVTLRPISKGLYPSESLYPSNDLFPRDEPTTEKINRNIYSYCSGADYDVAPIDCLNIKQEENDVGVTVGSGTNQYNIIGNFLAFGLSTQELTTAANNAFEVIKRASYAPVLLNVKGNYCRELGDQLRIYTSDRILYTYILNRTIEGIQSLNEAIEATGTELQEEDINSVYSSIEQLRGKSNVLTRTLEETRSEITDIESGLSSKIQQNASSIELEVKQRKGADDVLASSIKQTADNIKAEVLAKEGGNVKSFGWSLTATKFTLSANNKSCF